MAEWILKRCIEVLFKAYNKSNNPYKHLSLFDNNDFKDHPLNKQDFGVALCVKTLRDEHFITINLYNLAIEFNCLTEILSTILNVKFVDISFPVQEIIDLAWTIPDASHYINFKDIKLCVSMYKCFMDSNVTFNNQKNQMLNLQLKTLVYLDRVLGILEVSNLILGYLY